MNRVISVTPQDDHSLILVFDDGAHRIFDVRPYLDKGIFVELKSLAYFKQVRIAFGTVQWPHHQDFAPETLYQDSRMIAAAQESSSVYPSRQQKFARPGPRTGTSIGSTMSHLTMAIFRV
jgi:hypothetical protein